MRIRFDTLSPVSEVTKLTGDIKPSYGKKGSTARGEIHCKCGVCVGFLLLDDANDNNFIVGWLDTDCEYCKSSIDYSDALENI